MIARTPEVKVENYLVFPVGISGALEAGITISEAQASERMNVYDSRGPEVHLGVTRVSARATILTRYFEYTLRPQQLHAE
jgi:hypothetical protein